MTSDNTERAFELAIEIHNGIGTTLAAALHGVPPEEAAEMAAFICAVVNVLIDSQLYANFDGDESTVEAYYEAAEAVVEQAAQAYSSINIGGSDDDGNNNLLN